MEGNTTFYAVPSADTISRWVEETPPSFQLCPKIPKTISHNGTLVEHIQEAREFVQIMSQLGSRLGPMFLQLPPSYPPAQINDLRAFLEAWQQDTRLAVEVRHIRWFDETQNEALNRLLAETGAARVVIDTRPIRSLKGDKILEGSVYLRLLQARERKPDLPIIPELTSDFIFLRFIGHPQMEENLPIIQEWAGILANWLKAGIHAYVFCHCPDERMDPLICLEFHRRIADLFPVPPLPWDNIETGLGSQETLF